MKTVILFVTMLLAGQLRAATMTYYEFPIDYAVISGRIPQIAGNGHSSTQFLIQSSDPTVTEFTVTVTANGTDGLVTVTGVATLDPYGWAVVFLPVAMSDIVGTPVIVARRGTLEATRHDQSCRYPRRWTSSPDHLQLARQMGALHSHWQWYGPRGSGRHRQFDGCGAAGGDDWGRIAFVPRRG